MVKRIIQQLFSKELPKWFRMLNACILLPVLVWPFIFYATIFLFDHPQNIAITCLLFVAINAYPVYLVVIACVNSFIFRKRKLFGAVLPAAVVLAIVCGVGYIALETGRGISRSTKKQEERTKQGYIDVGDDFKIVNNKVYRYDTLIAGADAASFEVVSWCWQRDKNYYYYFGKKIGYIDRNSFEDLDYDYGKDKAHVYYREKIIESADAKTFVHIEGTQDGKDAHNCYRRGKSVDCKVLQSEE